MAQKEAGAYLHALISLYRVYQIYATTSTIMPRWWLLLLRMQFGARLADSSVNVEKFGALHDGKHPRK